MPTTCAVADCKKSSDKIYENGKLSFHRIPVKNEKLARIWVKFCKRKINMKTAFICSSHFTQDDYQRDLRNEMLGLPTRKILKEGAIPSVYPNRSGETLEEIARNERVQKRNWIVERKSIVNELLNNLKDESDETSDEHEERLATRNQKRESTWSTVNCRDGHESINNLLDSEVKSEPASSPKPDPEPDYFELTRDHLLQKLDSLWDIILWKNRKLIVLQRKVERLETQLNCFRDRTEEFKRRYKTDDDDDDDEFLWDGIKEEEGISHEIDDKEGDLILIEKSLGEFCKFNKIQLQEEQAFPEEDGEIQVGSSTIKTKTLILPTSSSACQSQFLDREKCSVDPLEDTSTSQSGAAEDKLGNKGACCPKHRQMFKQRLKGDNKPKIMPKDSHTQRLEAKPKLKFIISWNWKCRKCNELFKTKTALQNHNLRQHPIMLQTNDRSDSKKVVVVRKNKLPKRECPICQKKDFRTEIQFENHVQRHIMHKRECPICRKKGFRTEVQLENHVQRHTGIICMFCGKSFKRKHQLLLHEKQHQDGSLTKDAKKKEKTAYKCSTCEFTTLYKNSLTSHTLRFHTDNPEISNTCEYCGRGFLLKKNYKRHVKMHQGGSGHEGTCTICDKSFKNLKTHVYDVHSGRKPIHECPYCDKKFKRKTHVTQHLQYFHRCEQERANDSSPVKVTEKDTSKNIEENVPNEPGTSKKAVE